MDHDEDDDDVCYFVANFADHVNRRMADELYEIPADLPANAVHFEVTSAGSGHSVMTPFGPLTAADAYILVPVETDETNLFPDEQCAFNWIVMDLAKGDTVAVEGSEFTVSQTSLGKTEIFDVEDVHGFDDWTPIQIPAREHRLEDMMFIIIDEELEAVMDFLPGDKEMAALKFNTKDGKPRTNWQHQLVTIDAAGRALLEELATPVAKALIKERDDVVYEHGYFSLYLGKPAPQPAPRLPLAA
ncbi:hypothetical protein [Croceicoccus gelatinilyticus]|uniref:hypothetical protein n=1 Tax=Croceicoccus gelatinilyticus TaxID=2835536 RepID=UPI001BCED68A|nr:hypothetical protein [Croceicoccus gelatinilyticus]MBS7671504.1 hypothetical protein [Croceicoccus gelatinilyticus]